MNSLSLFQQLPSFDRLKASEFSDEMFDLKRFQRFLNQIGNPERGLPVIHIVGSKGKGSTAALIASALQSLDKKVGAFLSPYIGHPTESIFVNGRAMNTAIFDRMMNEFQGLVETYPVTSFEVLTAMALCHFHEQNVDFVVMEAGLGGLNDATNVVESPIATVVCPIEKEHTNVLGNSIASIAYEKLGVIRDETPVILAPQDVFVDDFAKTACMQKKAPCLPVNTSYDVSILERNWDGYSFRLGTPSRNIPRINLALLGDHQVMNAVTAWGVLDTLLPGFDPEPVLNVWSGLTLSGRLEPRVRDGRDFILDGAHTPSSAKALRRTLDQVFGTLPITFILAFFEDKNVEAFAHELLRVGDAVVLTQVNHPRALPAREIEARLRNLWTPDQLSLSLTNNPRIAWQKACKLAGRGPICVTGSFSLMGKI